MLMSKSVIAKILPKIYANIWLMLLGLEIGTIVFWLMYGFGPLDVTNDRWIMSWYDESDIVQHYAGWCAFRNSVWHFPLGFVDTMGEGTYVSYTDSIPWVAFFFKLILQIFDYNGTFQYFGLYALACYILQAIGAGLLIRRKTSNCYVISSFMFLLSLSPIFIERSLRHTALGSQWLILFALFSYLEFIDRKCKRFPISFSILALLAVGIHPYFVPLVLIFSLLSMLSSIYRKSNILNNFIGFSASIFFPVIGGLVIGAIGSDNGASLSRWGYGFYSMNLNAILNPTSIGGYEWSRFFKEQPQILGNYDGFNYLGVGYLLVIGLAAFSIVINPPKLNRYKIFDLVAYVVISICTIAFAVSNVVTFNDRVLAKVYLPEVLLNFCGIFRASSRIFYFTYYSLVIFSIYRIVSVMQDKQTNNSDLNIKVLRRTRNLPLCLVLVVCCLIQYVDLSGVVSQKHFAMTEKLRYSSIVDDTYLSSLVNGKHYFFSVTNNNMLLDRTLAVFAAKNHLVTTYSVAINAKIDLDENRKINKILDDFYFGVHKDDIVVAYDDIPLAKAIYNDEQIKSGTKYYQTNDFAFIISTKDTSDQQRNKNEFIANSLTDQYWTRGVLKDGNTIRFDYSPDLLGVLVNGAKYVSVQGNKSAITNFNFDERWIRVRIDKKAQNCAFPSKITFLYQ